MKNGRLQCKDIDPIPILLLLWRSPGVWHTRWESEPGSMPSVLPAFPAGTHEALVLAKMHSLIKRGFVDGCCCGCRGDFTVGPLIGPPGTTKSLEQALLELGARSISPIG